MAVTYFARRRHTLTNVCKRIFLSILALKKGRVTGVISGHFKSVGEPAQENKIKSRLYLASELSINRLYRMFIAETAVEHKNIVLQKNI